MVIGSFNLIHLEFYLNGKIVLTYYLVKKESAFQAHYFAGNNCHCFKVFFDIVEQKKYICG